MSKDGINWPKIAVYKLSPQNVNKEKRLSGIARQPAPRFSTFFIKNLNILSENSFEDMS